MQTSRGYIIFFQLERDLSVSHLFHCADQRSSKKKESSELFFVNHRIPAIRMKQDCAIRISGGVQCMSQVRDDLFVSCGDGIIRKLSWDGSTSEKNNIAISSLPFCLDLDDQPRATLYRNKSVFVRQMQFCPLMGGLALVLSDGRAAFLIPQSIKFEPTVTASAGTEWRRVVPFQQCRCVLAQAPGHESLQRSHLCLAANHRYRLIAYGCSSGEAILYYLDEVTGAMQVSHILVLPPEKFPETSKHTGPLSLLKWSPDESVLVVAWESGGFALWTAFGALLVCSLSGDFSMPNDACFLHLRSLEWAAEGYELWAVPADGGSEHFCILDFARSMTAVNYYGSPNDVVLLLTGDRLLVSLNESQNACSSSRGWLQVLLPPAYLSSNWPIRYASLDESGQCVAIAGRAGFAHCWLPSRRWKLFGNEGQEQNMAVTGSMAWWAEFVCLGCFDEQTQCNEIRLYSRHCKVDNLFAHSTRVPTLVSCVSVLRDLLVAYCSDNALRLFALRTVQADRAELLRLQEIALNYCVPHPYCVLAVLVTSLRAEPASPPGQSEPESILINCSGRLLFLARDRLVNAVPGRSPRSFTFSAATPIASCVEQVWCPRGGPQRAYLNNALWLDCGAAGIKVWLPLFGLDKSLSGFMAKRIMLQFKPEFYPLGIAVDDAELVGVQVEVSQYEGVPEPYCAIQRVKCVCLQHILRQLLRRNLGPHAFQVAQSCSDLPHFSHVLELLLHEVLEEEATSSEPLPDPLLPRVLAFVREFPHWRKTIAHCARKSEFAWWPHLFGVVGGARELFDECLRENDLETAAAYLLVLQNLEPPLLSRQLAARLLETSLEQYRWSLARELFRFLRAIDPEELHVDSPRGPTSPKDSSSFSFSRKASMALDLVPQRTRTHSRDKAPPLRRHSSGGSRESLGERADEFLDAILRKQVRAMLSGARLKELGAFGANLLSRERLVAMLRREEAYSVEHFPSALLRLHDEFGWPKPTLVASGLPNRPLTSGYLLRTLSIHDDAASTNGDACDSGLLTPALAAARPLDALVLPLHPKEECSSHTTEESSTANESAETASNYSAADSDVILLPDLVPKGDSRAEQQLRYLFDVLLEGECFEWAFLVACALQEHHLISDLSAALLHHTSARKHIQQVCTHLDKGLAQLEEWVNAECLGYRMFIQHVRQWIEHLRRQLAQRHQAEAEDLSEHEDSALPTPPRDDQDEPQPDKADVQASTSNCRLS